jgi:hypothetical protein
MSLIDSDAHGVGEGQELEKKKKIREYLAMVQCFLCCTSAVTGIVMAFGAVAMFAAAHSIRAYGALIGILALSIVGIAFQFSMRRSVVIGGVVANVGTLLCVPWLYNTLGSLERTGIEQRLDTSDFVVDIETNRYLGYVTADNPPQVKNLGIAWIDPLRLVIRPGYPFQGTFEYAKDDAHITVKYYVDQWLLYTRAPRQWEEILAYNKRKIIGQLDVLRDHLYGEAKKRTYEVKMPLKELLGLERKRRINGSELPLDIEERFQKATCIVSLSGYDILTNKGFTSAGKYAEGERAIFKRMFESEAPTSIPSQWNGIVRITACIDFTSESP